MSYQGPKVFRDAVSELAKLPGIGEKTAQRLVLHLARAESTRVGRLSTALLELKAKLTLCKNCCGLTEESPCPICADTHRDTGLICIVEDPSDVFAIERSGQFRGVYHVLHGRLAPLEGVGPDELKLKELLERVKAHLPREVVLATNPDVEGEATALYVGKLLSTLGVKTSRIAMGIPMGGHLEYADHVTLGRALAERRAFSVT